MLEESKMDKKSINRSSQLQSKANAIDCKKNSDSTQKLWPRNNKKREGNGSAPKNEPYRRNVPLQSQRGRGQLDRKPRYHGPTGYSMGGTQNTGIEDDDEPEIGSVFVPGSKKQNLNHLLNFMYPSRGGQDRKGPQPRRQIHLQRPLHRHEHDLYLRAYCQFVVKEDGDYKINLLDPDVPVKWEQIEEIVVRGSGRAECPICLGAPVAGRVGPCGHVHCWPCALHYAHANEKHPPPCPVCASPMHVDRMKPALLSHWDYSNEEVTMRLVRRLRGSTVVEIAPDRRQLPDDTPPSVMPVENIKNFPYCKLFSANKKQVQQIMEREKREIENQILEEIDTTEIIFLEQALNMLKLRDEVLSEQYEGPKVMINNEIDEAETPIVYEKQEVSNSKLDWFDVTDDGEAIDIIKNKMEKTLEMDSTLNPDAEPFIQDDTASVVEFPLIECSPPGVEGGEECIVITDIDKQNQAKYFYFYQAEDGQQVFLNSLNVRVLNASWGALAAAPSVIRGRVLHRETLPLTEQTRKHMPFTAHLPLYCAFDVVELQLEPPHVTTAALNRFKDELDRRARMRARQERDERRRERAFRRAVEGPPRPDFFSPELFPPAAAPSCPSPPPDSGQASSFDLPGPSPSTSAGSPPQSGPSFAKMASTNGIWRVRKNTEPPPQPLDDTDASGPRSLSLSDAIEAALHAVPPPSAKKNKKPKHKLLFATGVQHAG